MVLDRKITIQHPVTTRGDFNEEIITWTELFQAWSNITFLTGKEIQIQTTGENKQQIGIQPTFFTIRYKTGLKRNFRIIFENEVYEITAIQEIQRRQWIQITAELRDNLKP